MNEKKFIAKLPKAALIDQKYRNLSELIQRAIEEVSGTGVHVNIFNDDDNVVLRVEQVPLTSFEYTDY